jgi:hypothetical protein
LCQRFVEQAYGVSGRYPTAAAAARALTTRPGKDAWKSAPPGALLFFAPDASNAGNGHVGIALGNGTMISATSAGVREDRLDNPYWSRLFTGWGEAAPFSGRRDPVSSGAGSSPPVATTSYRAVASTHPVWPAELEQSTRSAGAAGPRLAGRLPPSLARR